MERERERQTEFSTRNYLSLSLSLTLSVVRRLLSTTTVFAAQLAVATFSRERQCARSSLWSAGDWAGLCVGAAGLTGERLLVETYTSGLGIDLI